MTSAAYELLKLAKRFNARNFCAGAFVDMAQAIINEEVRKATENLLSRTDIHVKAAAMGLQPAAGSVPASVPHGWVLLPRRITREMAAAWADDDGDVQTAWSALIAATKQAEGE